MVLLRHVADLARSSRALYALTAVLVVLHGIVLAAALNPDVPPDVRAYYIERSTDCWEQTVAGAHLDETVELTLQPATFRHDMMTRLGLTPQRALLVCGWIGPEPMGAWSSGPESRLRFRLAGSPRDLRLVLQIRPFLSPEHSSQRAVFYANGEPLATLTLAETSPVLQTVGIPAEIAFRQAGVLEVAIGFPDARSPRELGVNRDPRRLAVRLLSARLESLPELP